MLSSSISTLFVILYHRFLFHFTVLEIEPRATCMLTMCIFLDFLVLQVNRKGLPRLDPLFLLQPTLPFPSAKPLSSDSSSYVRLRRWNGNSSSFQGAET